MSLNVREAIAVDVVVRAVLELGEEPSSLELRKYLGILADAATRRLQMGYCSADVYNASRREYELGQAVR